MKARKFLFFLIIFFGLVLLLYLISDFLYGDYSFSQNKELTELVQQKEQELINISSENEKLKQDIASAKQAEKKPEDEPS